MVLKNSEGYPHPSWMPKVKWIQIGSLLNISVTYFKKQYLQKTGKLKCFSSDNILKGEVFFYLRLASHTFREEQMVFKMSASSGLFFSEFLLVCPSFPLILWTIIPSRPLIGKSLFEYHEVRGLLFWPFWIPESWFQIFSCFYSIQISCFNHFSQDSLTWNSVETTSD